MQWIIDILGLICLALVVAWLYFRKKNEKLSRRSLIGFFVLVAITMIAAYFIKH